MKNNYKISYSKLISYLADGIVEKDIKDEFHSMNEDEKINFLENYFFYSLPHYNDLLESLDKKETIYSLKTVFKMETGIDLDDCADEDLASKEFSSFFRDLMPINIEYFSKFFIEHIEKVYRDCMGLIGIRKIFC